MSIQGFACIETKNFFNGVSNEFSNIKKVLSRKLTAMDSAKLLSDLRSPGNALHKLGSDRDGQHSIRINDQYRICFVWTIIGPDKVEVVDYH